MKSVLSVVTDTNIIVLEEVLIYWRESKLSL